MLKESKKTITVELSTGEAENLMLSAATLGMLEMNVSLTSFMLEMNVSLIRCESQTVKKKVIND